MESKSWPARGERGAPTRCWQDREMRGRWGKRIGQSAARPTEPSSDEQPRATPLPGQDPKGRKTGAQKHSPVRVRSGCQVGRPHVRWWRSQPSAVRPDTGAFSGHEKGRGAEAPHDLGSLGSTHLATENKPVTKGHVFPDSIYHEKSTRGKSVERRVEEGLSGAGRPGGKGVSQLKGTRFIFEVVKMS